MGGCRCTFRGCDNATGTRPGIHFFHYPVKDSDRLVLSCSFLLHFTTELIFFSCNKWILMANNPSYRDMEEPRLKNRNVCEDHFRLEMFMNIKKERLIRTAYPSLLVIRSRHVIDLERMLNDDLNIDYLSVHCDMSPELEPYVFGMPEILSDFRIEKVTSGEKNQDIMNMQIEYLPMDGQQTMHDEPSTPEHAPSHYSPPTTSNTGQVLLNSISEASDNKRKYPSVSSNITILTPVSVKKIKREPTLSPLSSNSQPKILLNSKNPIKSMPVSPKIGTDHSTVTVTDGISPTKLKDLEIRLKKKTETENKLLRQNSMYQQKICDLQTQIDNLQRKLASVEAEKQKKPITQTISVQTDAIIPIPTTSNNSQGRKSDPGAPSTKPGNLTKPQLFNGIKRYLSNAMSTLLKMEMFGGSEREWKVDEKKISCEIMELGRNVYEYFTDEWRLRLPPKNEVLNWMEENSEEDDEDLY